MKAEEEDQHRKMIKETVIQILKTTDMDVMTVLKVRNMAAQKLGINLSAPELKQFVRDVVESFILPISIEEEPVPLAAAAAAAQKQEKETKLSVSANKGKKEIDDYGDAVIYRLSNKREVTVQDGKQLIPSSTGSYKEKRKPTEAQLEEQPTAPCKCKLDVSAINVIENPEHVRRQVPRISTRRDGAGDCREQVEGIELIANVEDLVHYTPSPSVARGLELETPTTAAILPGSEVGTRLPSTSFGGKVSEGDIDQLARSSENREEEDEKAEDEESNGFGKGVGRGRGSGTVGGRASGIKGGRKKKVGEIPSYVQMGELGGGPQNETVLKSFREHIAHAIWVGQQRNKVIKLVYHHKKFTQWNFENESKRFKSLYMSSEIAELSMSSFSTVDHVLASSMIERWHPETSTFHLPFGEMTITLDDVKQILDVPVTGKPVVGTSTFGTKHAKALLMKTLGITSLEAETELKGSSVVPLDWLVKRFSGTRDPDPDNEMVVASTDAEVEAAVRAYHLFVLGSMVLTNKSGTKISVQYLQFMKDLKEIPKYNWGSAVLAYLYRQLSIACKADTKHMGGCHTLLQVWIHEHLNFGNPILAPDYDENTPRVNKWIARHLSVDPNTVLNMQRETLDDMNRSMVVWEPYSLHRNEHPFPEISYFKGCLICLDIVEMYHPDRVLRQFGRYQSIPKLPVPHSHKSDTSLLAGYLHSWTDHCLAKEKRGELVTDGWDADERYPQWYTDITHRIVQNPQFRVRPAVVQQSDGDRGNALSGGIVENLEMGLSLCRQAPCHTNLPHILNKALIDVNKFLTSWRVEADEFAELKEKLAAFETLKEKEKEKGKEKYDSLKHEVDKDDDGEKGLEEEEGEDQEKEAPTTVAPSRCTSSDPHRTKQGTNREAKAAEETNGKEAKFKANVKAKEAKDKKGIEKVGRMDKEHQLKKREDKKRRTKDIVDDENPKKKRLGGKGKGVPR